MGIFELRNKIIRPGIEPFGYSYGTLWTPAEKNAALWLDATDTDTLSLDVLANIQQWSDKSGKGNNFTQSTELKRPDLIRSGGLEMVSFSRAYDQCLVKSSNSFLNLDDKGGASIFVVFNYHGYVNEGSGINALFFKGDSTSTSVSYGFKVGSSNTLNLKAAADLSRDSDVFTNQKIIVSLIRTDTTASDYTCYVYVNGLSYGSASDSSTSSDNSNSFYIAGDGVDSRRYSDVDFGELIILNGSPLEEDRYRIEGYLAHKWDLEAELPPDHPYKSKPPVIS